jgi:uncharacterized protein with PIN domain
MRTFVLHKYANEGVSMRPWQEDKRFLCPDCGHVVELKSVKSIKNNTEEEIYTNNDLVAICTRCKRPFLAEQ